MQSNVVAGLSAAIRSLNKLIPPRTERELTDNFCVAESSLRASEDQGGFAPLLLQIVASDSFASNTRLAAALYFKNLLGRNWTVGSPAPQIIGGSLKFSAHRMRKAITRWRRARSWQSNGIWLGS